MYSLKIVLFNSKMFAVVGLQSEVKYATAGLRTLLELNSRNIEDVVRPRPEINIIPANQRLVCMEKMTGSPAYEIIKNS